MTRDVATPGYTAGATYSSWPFILSMIGGVLVLIEGLIIAISGPLISLAVVGDLGLGVLLYGILVIILGLIMMWLAYGLRSRPASHVAYGAGIIIVSVIALVLAGGGFVIGSIMGIIGGAWAIIRG
ncbi:MAG: hypothetical protein ISF22_06365 [Methanomassiliicoccus sp.]|nr:hypothetical protein [Methanomassiliicoccus sp.]